MTAPLKVAIAGLGTVGAGTLTLLQFQADLIAARAGRPITVVAVSARDRRRHREVVLDGLRWYDDAAQMAAEADIDVVVEAIGGAEGIALAVCRAAIAGGRHLVTANKALLALSGVELAAEAEAKGVTLGF